MYLKPVQVNELKKYIAIAFENDYDLLVFYDEVLNVKSIEECVDDTYEKILDYEISYKNIFSYKVEFTGEDIGYLFVMKNPNVLVSFGINVNYRDKIILNMFYREIKKIMNYEFICFLHQKNTRAKKWLLKCGMLEVPTNIENVIKLKY